MSLSFVNRTVRTEYLPIINPPSGQLFEVDGITLEL